jgi:hypothetical protein
LDTPELVESENINLKIGNGSSLYQLFSKRYFYFINWGALQKVNHRKSQPTEIVEKVNPRKSQP